MPRDETGGALRDGTALAPARGSVSKALRSAGLELGASHLATSDAESDGKPYRSCSTAGLTKVE